MKVSGSGLAELVRTYGRVQPDAPAITFGSEVASWGRLDQRSSQVADALVSLGLRAGDRIAYIGKNTPEYFELLLGAAKVGVVTVAINWRLMPEEVRFIVDDAQARALFADPEGVTKASELSVTTVVVFRSEGATLPSGTRPYEGWLAEHEPVDPGFVAEPNGVALQLYTSGTTGLPKGALLTNANLHGLFDESGSMFGIDQSSVNLVALPVFHIGGAGYALVGMAQGCQTILMHEFEPETVLKALRGHHVTNTFFVPAMLAAMAAVPDAQQGDYSALRSITYGASPITDESLKTAIRTFRCDFIQVYGMTETSGAITQLAASDHDPDGPRSYLLRSAGRPFDWVEIRIVDPDTGKDCSSGGVGELWTRSRQNMMGYWNNPEATALAITADGWLLTGDAGYVDDEGHVFLTDRIKDMIVSGGENVYPVEVENVLSGEPSIADVAVIGVPDAKWGETVKAVVVLKPGADPDADRIIQFARQRIAHFKCPTTVDFVDALPRNASGKVLKRQLREPYWEGHQRRVG
jgi:acyl-CoA synthetase (AMP-forming)/AMP-acid ligase II